MGERARTTRSDAKGKPAGYVRAFLSVVPDVSAEADSRSIDVVASTDAVDGCGRVVVQDWDLSRFEKNPVVLWEHGDAGGGGLFGGGVSEIDALLPIGKASNVRVEKGALRATITFAEATANPLAEKIYQSFRQGILRAVSVGWVPHEVEYDADADVLVCRQNELLEISVVALPCNPDAVAERARMVASLRASALNTEDRMSARLQIMIASILGFSAAATTTEEEVAERVGTIARERNELLAALGVESASAAKGKIAGMKELAESAAMTAAKLATLETTARESEVVRLLDVAKAKGVTPAKRAKFLTHCGADDKGKGADPVMLASLLEMVEPTKALEIEEPAGPTRSTIAAAGLPPVARRMAAAVGADPAKYAAHREEYFRSLRGELTTTDEET